MKNPFQLLLEIAERDSDRVIVLLWKVRIKFCLQTASLHSIETILCQMVLLLN